MPDDMGFECLESYGGASYETYVLDSLAARGVRFEHCYSTPLFTPSRVQIMTGQYNFRNYTGLSKMDTDLSNFKTYGNGHNEILSRT